MDWNDLLGALALYLVLEGLLPFASPGRWRESFALIARLEDAHLRIFGAASIGAGLLLLYFVRG
jgi:uncharacterized protein YjeT (DUF2065 family)